MIEREFGIFTAVYFAMNISWRCKPFYGRFGSGEIMGIDTFAMDWSEEFGYFHSPVSMISEVIRRAEWLRVRGLLVALDQPGSYHSMLLQERIKEGRMQVVMMFKAWMVCLEDILSNTL